MKEEKKLSLKDELQAWAGGIGIVAGLFGFSVILGMALMDYDPMTMVTGIAEDLRTIFETIKNFFRS
jgi:hypothetical protein